MNIGTPPKFLKEVDRSASIFYYQILKKSLYIDIC